MLVHVGTNDVDKKGSEEVMGRYRELVRELKRVRVGQIVLSGYAEQPQNFHQPQAAGSVSGRGGWVFKHVGAL